MGFLATYPFARDLRQFASWTSEAFTDVGPESCQSMPVEFARPYESLPLVEVRCYADPTAVVAWVSDVSEAGCTLNVYRISGVDPVTVLWVADAPTQ